VSCVIVVATKEVAEEITDAITSIIHGCFGAGSGCICTGVGAAVAAATCGATLIWGYINVVTLKTIAL
jgi:hypothetical protein